jgi:hypothetical protein
MVKGLPHTSTDLCASHHPQMCALHWLGVQTAESLSLAGLLGNNQVASTQEGPHQGGCAPLGLVLLEALGAASTKQARTKRREGW